MSDRKVFYYRLSHVSQTEESQKQACPPDTAVFGDTGVTRDVKLTERAGFQECLDYLGDEGGIIYVSAFDRIGGEAAIAGAIHYGHLPENVDVNDAQGNSLRNDPIIRAVLAVLADAEKQNNSERQSRRAERQRSEGRLDCPQSFGFDFSTRQIIPAQMDALSIAFNEYTAGTPVAEIMRIILRETGLKLDRRRFYEWKNGKHFERIPKDYLDKWSKKTETELYWAGYYWELVEEYGDNLMAREFWEETRDICLDNEHQQRMFLKVFLPWLENDNFLLQKPNTDHLVNRKGETFAFGRYSEGFNEV
jgi:DNA invertase Pin-like site-specific DNA recombinase